MAPPLISDVAALVVWLLVKVTDEHNKSPPPLIKMAPPLVEALLPTKVAWLMEFLLLPAKLLLIRIAPPLPLVEVL
jgi:hypothetical protein